MGKKRAKKTPDPNQLAFNVLSEIIAKHDPEASVSKAIEDGKNPAAVMLGRLGGLKGGPARAKKLGKKKLSQIGKLAAEARWKNR